jgi:RecB family exonuclease
LLRGLTGRAGRAGLVPLWSAALSDAAIPQSRVEPDALAAARLAVLDEFDPSAGHARVLGPYFGFAGAIRDGGDPRHGPVYVTALESLARCPWRYFVEKLLRIEATPDPLDCLPELDPLAIGSATHSVLEAIGANDPGVLVRSDLSEAIGVQGAALSWPDRATLEAIIRKVVANQLAETGRPWPGLESVLCERVMPLLERARLQDWEAKTAAGTKVLGVEIEEVVEVTDAAGKKRSIAFRADRVDRVEHGNFGLVLTDYKTGKLLSDAKRESTRYKHLIERVRAGTHLQAAAYACILRAKAEYGRYLYLHEESEPGCADVRVDPADEVVRDAFTASLADLFESRDCGSFVPRLIEGRGDEEPGACKHCAVAEACLRGDTGASQRLARWLETSASEATHSAEQSLVRVFDLPQVGVEMASEAERAAKAAKSEKVVKVVEEKGA